MDTSVNPVGRERAVNGRVEHGAAGAGKSAGDRAIGGGANRSRAVLEWSSASPVLLALGFAAGAYVYFALPMEPSWALVLGAVAVFTATLPIVRRLPAIWPMTLAGVAVAMSVGTLHAKGVALRTDTVTVSGEVGPMQLEGWLRQVEGGRNGPRLRIQVHAIQGMDASQIPSRVRVTHPLSLNVAPGRFVRCRVVLRQPPAPSIAGDYDFRRQAYFEGLGAVGYVQGRCRGGALGAPNGLVAQATLWIDGQRRRLAEYVNRAAGERAGGFAAALVSGDRSFMDQSDQEALRASGLAHLLAISGLHLGIVCGLVYLIVRRSLAVIEPLAVRLPVQKPAAALALTAGLVYLILSGGSVSTQRAYVMAAIFFGAILFDRPGFSMRAFAVAMVAVVAIDPVSVVSPGFQMSFAATGALIATYEAWNRARRAKLSVQRTHPFISASQSLVVTSVVASFATAPFALYHFDRVAGAGLIANFLAMPIVSVVTAPSAALAMILAPFGLADWGLRLFGASLEAVLWVAHWAAAWPGQMLLPDWPMPASALGLATAAMGWAMVVGGPWRWLGLGVVSTLAGVAWLWGKGPDAHWAPNGDVYLASSSGVVRVSVIDGDGLGPLRYSDLDVGAVCTEGVCAFPVHRGIAEIRWIRGEPELCLRSNDAATGACETALTWRDVLNGSPASFKMGDTFSGPECTPRPWAPCGR
ncbi:MAG: ComEC/Rec2 family competence protein [Pseudomonadota bacterium]